MDIQEDQLAVLLDTIRRKMSTNPLKIRADFTLTCTTYEGIDIIKEALLTAKHAVNDDAWVKTKQEHPVEFKMIAPPNYKVEVVTHNKAEGEQKLQQALKIISEVMKSHGGKFRVMTEPTVIGANKDEPDVADLIDNMNKRGDESGDSNEEDNQEGMGDVDLTENVPVEDNDEEEDK